MTLLAEPEPESFPSGGHMIDARVHRPRGAPRGAIAVAHPHPAHGGDMDHPVVLAIADSAAAAGLLALRFDFRGVGASEGSVHDAEGHLEDAVEACRKAAALAPGLLLAGGFSYGARAYARLAASGRLAPLSVAGLLLLAPATRVPRSPRDFGNLLLGRPLTDSPPDLETLDALSRLTLPVRVIVGSNDAVSLPSDLRSALPPHAILDVLPSLSHFFTRSPGSGPLASDLLTLLRSQAPMFGSFGTAPRGRGGGQEPSDEVTRSQ